MPDKSINDILAEMRGARNAASDMTLVPSEWLTQWADRIEAAAKRESEIARDLGHIDEHSDQMERAATILERALNPGNAAAMREALEYAREVLALNGYVEPVVRCDAALAAPARNCDRFATAAKAMHEWERYKATAPIPPGGWCLGDAFTWLFTKAEGRTE